MENGKGKLKIVKLRIDSLTMDPENAKLHPGYQVQQIKKSIEDFGMNDPIGVWGENNLIVEGHGRVMAMQLLGETEIDCIRLDHLSEEERKAYALAHNSTNMSTGFDNSLLLKLIEDVKDNFNMEDYGIVLTKLDDSALAKEDDYEPDPQAPIRVHKGEVWELGRHRLACGDSTDPAVIDELLRGGEKADAVITDPPYNVNYTGQDGMKIDNDHMESQEFQDFLTKAFKEMYRCSKDGGAFYVWFASREHVNFEKALNRAGFTVRQQLIWVKNALVLGRQDYQWRHEPCLYGWKDGKHYFREDRTQTTVQENDKPIVPKKMKKDELVKLCEELLKEPNEAESTVIREDKPPSSDLHPTMKPIKLIARLVANSTKRDEIVLDLFGGSGSTLMACEQLGRVCRTVELDEKYATAIVNRWEEYTHQKARRL